MDGHTQIADAIPLQAHGRSQHQVGSIRFEQIRRTHLSLKSFGNQGHYVHECIGGLALFRGEIGDLFQREDMRHLACKAGSFQRLNSVVIFLQFQAL